MMKFSLTIILVLMALRTNAQVKLCLADTPTVSYQHDYDLDLIDSTVSISKHGELTLCDKYEVYFDKEMHNLAYKSGSVGDTCYVYNFWRNGKLKRKTTYYKDTDGFPMWWYDEAYCENGQVIFNGPSPSQPEKKLYINYYCNGNKCLEFYHLGMGADGKMMRWYENGVLESESYFDKNIPIGDWKYWNQEGQLIKTEHYENGELVKSPK